MAVAGARPATRIGVLGRRSHPRPRRVPQVRRRGAERPGSARRALRRARTTSISTLLVAITAAAGLCLLYLGQSTHVAAMGYEIDSLQSRIAGLQAQQQRLIVQIGQARSPSVIEERAQYRLHLAPIDPSRVVFAPSSSDPSH
jgi:hypothetical protein